MKFFDPFWVDFYTGERQESSFLFYLYTILFQHCMIRCKSILNCLTLLRLALWTTVWFVLEKYLWFAEKTVYSIAVGWNILWRCVMSISPRYDLTPKFLCDLFWGGVWLIYLFIGVGYWSHTLLLYLDPFVPLYPIVFVYKTRCTNIWCVYVYTCYFSFCIDPYNVYIERPLSLLINFSWSLLCQI
jgi:hypothetical protein